ncbi:MAG: ammonium transporter, partial [Rhodospirillaceae bacterium]|nr:ammonium transporter [Rhodospirillaceae bacterium]
TQLYGCGVVIVYCAIATFIIAKVLDLIIGLRVEADVEREGLDVNLHGEAVL